MGKYYNIAEQLKKKTTSIKKSQNNDIFSCYYCPTSRHDLCGHQSKCILNKDIEKLLISIKKINLKIWRLKQSENTQEQINRLIVERKKLFREYYSINTVAGGYER